MDFFFLLYTIGGDATGFWGGFSYSDPFNMLPNRIKGTQSSNTKELHRLSLSLSPCIHQYSLSFHLYTHTYKYTQIIYDQNVQSHNRQDTYITLMLINYFKTFHYFRVSWEMRELMISFNREISWKEDMKMSPETAGEPYVLYLITVIHCDGEQPVKRWCSSGDSKLFTLSLTPLGMWPATRRAPDRATGPEGW